MLDVHSGLENNLGGVRISESASQRGKAIGIIANVKNFGHYSILVTGFRYDIARTHKILHAVLSYLVTGFSKDEKIMASSSQSTPQYRNPIIDADLPDPDAIRVGGSFYMVCSSFNRAPGLPVFSSQDLVNWHRVGHALPGNEPAEWFGLPRHGAGVWAPSIRHHDGKFHIVYPDPDQGIFVVSAEDAAGPWSAPRLLMSGLGLIDPCPLWDEDGRAYLVHGWAGTRAARKNVLSVIPVDPGLTRILGADVDVIDGNLLAGYRTLEGPKFYKRDGWYWVFAPAGGVAQGWQSVFRSRSPYGPYEGRIVLEQGSSPINGPHQGAWVDTGDGSDWFLHFQDRGVFGRVLHLQPMRWSDEGWPLMGAAVHGGPVEPVTEYPTPFGTRQGSRTITQSDDFRSGTPGPQWSWQANPKPDWLSGGSRGELILRGASTDTGNLRNVPQVLGQPLPGLPCRASVSFGLEGGIGSRAGVVVLGRDYLWAGLRQSEDGLRAVVAWRRSGERLDSTILDEPLKSTSLTVRLSTDAVANVSIVLEADGFQKELCDIFTAESGQWIGAELGLFAAAPLGTEPASGRFGPFDIIVSEDEGKAHGDAT